MVAGPGGRSPGLPSAASGDSEWGTEEKHGARAGEEGHGSGCAPCDEPSRRDALKLLLGGALAPGALSRAVGAPGSGGVGATDVLVGDLAEIPVGSAASASFHGLPVLVINLDGGPVVLSAICTHEGCMVTWERGRKELLCPCHQGRFSGQGEVLEGPPPAPLLNFPVRVEGGKVYVVE